MIINNLKFNLKSISMKFLLPTILLLIISVGVVALIGYYTEKNILEQMMTKTVKSKISEVEKMINEREKNVEITKKALNKNFIRLTKLVERNIRDVKDDNLNQKLEEISKFIGVSEIHVVDGSGLIEGSTESRFIGFDFSSTKQTKPFLKGITNKDFVLAQEPTERGADSKLFQYIGVSRKDEPGIVQIGVQPKELNNLVKKLDITRLTQSLDLGNNGYIIITDLNGKIISHPNSSMIGNNLKQYDFGGEIFKNINNVHKENSIYYQYKNQKRFMSFSKYEDHLVIATIPVREYLGKLNDFRNKVLWTTLLSLIVTTIIIYFITRNVSKPLELAAVQCKQMAEGDFTKIVDEEFTERKDEIGDLAEGFNNITYSIQNMITNIRNSVEDLSAYSEELSASAEEGNATIDTTTELVSNMSASIEQISASTQEVTSFAQQSATQTEVGNENIDQTVASMQQINEAVEETVEVINDLDDNSQEIGKIIELITDIAEQTGQATDDIAILVQETQQKSESGLEAIKGVEVKVKEGQAIAEETGEVFKEIQEASEETSAHVQQTAASTQDLAQDSNEVMDATQDISNMSDEVTKSSQELADMAQELKSLVDQFKV